jgi:single-stranded-DNA-specific exonuclease
MNRAINNWVFKNPDPLLVTGIMEQLKLSRPAAEVLVNRGVTTATEARAFLSPSLDDTANPFLLPDILPAITRIRKALDANEKVLVYGDRDVDGVTSISVMVRTLRSLGADPLWYIPSEEGYGVHKEIIERYAAQDVTLIVTVDCGISAVEETEFARGLGIDVVVTDHHEPPSTGIPKAEAVVDPKRADSRYPFNELAGCYVSFKVSEALMLSFGKYFDVDLVFFDIAGKPETGTITAARVRNGLVADTFAGTGAEAVKAFLTFAADRRLVTHDAAKNYGELRRAAKGTAARELSNEVTDVLELAKPFYPLSAASLATLADDLKLHPSDDESGAAFLVWQVFQRIEKMNDLRMNFFQTSHLDVVTLGTIADIMPLVSENRIMVKQGLQRLVQSKKKGVQALLERCVNNKGPLPLSAKAISWNITPVLNAAGRRGKAALSAELLLTEDINQAHDLLDEILKLNTERRELQAENLEKFLPLLAEQCDLEKDKIFIVTASGIEHGVTGIIASQIMRQYKRPTILLIIEGDQAMGAARSVAGFDIVAAIGRLSGLLVKYGGHSQAAGLTVTVDKLEEFRTRLREIAEKEITPELLVPTIEIDTELQYPEITMDLLNELAELEPYGMGNPHPVFSLKGLKVLDHSRVGSNGSHLKLRVSRNGSASLQAMGWGLGHMEEDIAGYSYVDLAVQLEVNTWQDKQNIQLIVLDVKPAC